MLDLNNLPPTPDSQDVMKKAVVVKIALGKPGNRKRVIKGQINVVPNPNFPEAGQSSKAADVDMVHVSKDLLDSPELKAVIKYDAEIRAYVSSCCLPSFFEGGKWLLPVSQINTVDKMLTETMQVERTRLIDLFLEAYPAARAAAKERLDHLYREQDYPSVEQLRDAFTFEVSYLSFGVPGMLAEFSAEIFHREEEKLVRKVAEIGNECQNALRTGFAQLVGHMVERLQPGEDGKKKSFKVSMVENLSDFLANFSNKNLTGDADLEQLVKQAQEILEGQDPQEIAKGIRTDDEMRAKMQHRFEALKDQLDGMVGAKTSRAFDFEEEDGTAMSNEEMTNMLSTSTTESEVTNDE